MTAALGLGTLYLYLQAGWLPVLIVGGFGLPAVALWVRCYLPRPTSPSILLPPFLCSVAGFQLHSIEEYTGHYGPAIARLIAFGWTDERFIIAICVLFAALTLVSLGLFYQKAPAGLLATVFLMTRLAETLLFAFPYLRPAVLPDNPNSVDFTVASGVLVTHMPNYYAPVVGTYYFPGMYTWVLAVAPAIWALSCLWRARPPRG